MAQLRLHDFGWFIWLPVSIAIFALAVKLIPTMSTIIEAAFPTQNLLIYMVGSYVLAYFSQMVMAFVAAYIILKMKGG